MATTDNYNPEFTVKTTYTLFEALDYMKNRNRYPTTTTVNWRDARTGKQVHIGNSSM